MLNYLNDPFERITKEAILRSVDIVVSLFRCKTMVFLPMIRSLTCMRPPPPNPPISLSQTLVAKPAPTAPRNSVVRAMV